MSSNDKKSFILDISKRNWLSAKDFIINIEPNKDVAYLLSHSELPEIASKNPPSQMDVLKDLAEIESRVNKYNELKDMFSLTVDPTQKLEYDAADITTNLMSLRSGKSYKLQATKSTVSKKSIPSAVDSSESIIDEINPSIKFTTPVKTLLVLQKYKLSIKPTTDTKELDIRKAVGLLPSGVFLVYPENKEGETRFKADYEKHIRQFESYEKAVSITWSKLMSDYMTVPTRDAVRTHTDFERAESERNLLLLWSIMKDFVDNFGSLTPTMVICKFFSITDSDYSHWDQYVNDFRGILISMRDQEIILDDRIVSTFFKLKIRSAKESLPQLANWLETTEGEEANHEEVIAKVQEIRNKKRAQLGATAMMSGATSKVNQSKINYSVANDNSNVSTNKPNNNKSNNKPTNPCWNCCQLGHTNKTCRLPPVICTMCGDTGHYHFFCPKVFAQMKKAAATVKEESEKSNSSVSNNKSKDASTDSNSKNQKPKKNSSTNESTSKKGTINMINTSGEDEETSTTEDCGLMFVLDSDKSNRYFLPDDYGDDLQHSQQSSSNEDIPDSIIKDLQLDNIYFLTDDGANIHVVNNLSILPNASKLAEPKPINGVSGSIFATHFSELPHLGIVYYCAESPENVISLVQLGERDYTYSGSKDGVKVFDSKGKLIFTSTKRSSNRLNYVNYLEIDGLIGHLHHWLTYGIKGSASINNRLDEQEQDVILQFDLL